MAFKRNFAFRLAAEISAKILAMAITVLLARRLEPEAWGSIQWALAAAGIFGAMADFALGNMAMREISLSPQNKKGAWLRAAWMLKAVLWLLALACFAGYRAMQGASQGSLLVPAALVTVGVSLGEFNSSLFSGLERLDLDFWLATLSKFLQALGAFLALILGASPEKILYAMALSAWLGWGLGFISLRRLAPLSDDGKNMQRMGSLLKAMWPVGLVGLVTIISNRAGQLILERVGGAASVGVYQSAYKWYEALGFLPAAFIAAAFPALMRSQTEEGGREKRMRAFKAMGGLGAVATALLFSLAPLLPWIFGEKYAAAPPLLRSLCFACLAGFPNCVLLILLVAAHKQERILYGAVAAMAFNLVGNAWAIPAYGAQGAAWMTVGTELVIFTAAALSLGVGLPLASALFWLLGFALAGAAGCALALGLGPALAPASLLAAPSLSLALAWKLGLLPMDDLRALAAHFSRKKF